MKIKLAIVIGDDKAYFVAGNNFEDDERIMDRVEGDLELTGRIAKKKYFVEIELPPETKAIKL